MPEFLIKQNSSLTVEDSENLERGSWRCLFEEKIDLVERLRGLSRPDAKRAGFDIVLTEFLNRTHPSTDPSRCAHCSQSDATLLPFGAGLHHVWLHDRCWEAWRERRRTEAIAALVDMGVGR
jgi:hypothetical protein